MNSAPVAGAPVPTGNTFDKYGSTNPVVRRLMTGFEDTFDELLDRCAPTSVLDVGCGEGVLTERWAQRLGSGRVVGIDLPDPKLETYWSARTQRANLEFHIMAAERLDYSDGEFDLVAATEVLEHVAEPRRALSEMVRVAKRWLI